jgi:glycosyltransferase involved in cell wall biosynthesis
MRICHVTPHLPPDQAANALLPYHLGKWARAAGDEPIYIAHPPRAGVPDGLPGAVLWIRSRPDRMRGGQSRRAASLAEAVRIWRNARPLLRRADLVHVHSNGLLAEMCALLARTSGKPVVVTLYGTEIWHYRRRRFPDLFTRMYKAATEITFYSRGLLEHAQGLGLARPGLRVVYPPVAEAFAHRGHEAQRALREELGLRHRHLLVNVKRLHPLAGQRYLMEALPLIVRERPETHLVICGTGPLLTELRARAEGLRVASHVTFAGLVNNDLVARYCAAADLFVLPSMLEACPTVALEALAAGTPVVSSDNPGGVELHALFGDDVAVVPRRDAAKLATAVLDGLAQPRRTRPRTEAVLEQHFRPRAVDGAFRRVYADALEARYARSHPA